MYIVLIVVGWLCDDRTVYDVLVVIFLVGILSGVLKVWVMEFIDEMEIICCGLYGGIVGYFDFVGDFDMVIVICIVVICDGVVYV